MLFIYVVSYDYYRMPFFMTIIVHLHCVLFHMIFCVMNILSLPALSKIGTCFGSYFPNNEKWNYLDIDHIFMKLNKKIEAIRNERDVSVA